MEVVEALDAVVAVVPAVVAMGAEVEVAAEVEWILRQNPPNPTKQ